MQDIVAMQKYYPNGQVEWS